MTVSHRPPDSFAILECDTFAIQNPFLDLEAAIDNTNKDGEDTEELRDDDDELGKGGK